MLLVQFSACLGYNDPEDFSVVFFAVSFEGIFIILKSAISFALHLEVQIAI